MNSPILLRGLNAGAVEDVETVSPAINVRAPPPTRTSRCPDSTEIVVPAHSVVITLKAVLSPGSTLNDASLVLRSNKTPGGVKQCNCPCGNATDTCVADDSVVRVVCSLTLRRTEFVNSTDDSEPGDVTMVFFENIVCPEVAACPLTCTLPFNEMLPTGASREAGRTRIDEVNTAARTERATSVRMKDEGRVIIE
jgi:hypothetical protein